MFSSEHPYDFSSIDGRIFQVCLYFYIVGIPLTNGVIALMLIFRKRLRKVANLFVIYLSLSESVGGMIILSSMIDEMNGIQMSPIRCTAVLYMEHFALMCSIFSLLGIAVDRYRTVFYPQSYKPTLKRAIGTIILITLSAGIYSTIIFMEHVLPAPDMSQANKTKFDERICSTFLEDETNHIAMISFDSGAGFMLPMLIMAVLYIKIRKKLWSDDMIMASLTSTKKIRKATKLSFSCTALFFAFWFPYHVTELIHDIFEMHPDVISEDIEDVVDRIKHGTMLLVLTKSFISPIVYGFFSLAMKTEIWQCCQSLRDCKCMPNKVGDAVIEIAIIPTCSNEENCQKHTRCN